MNENTDVTQPGTTLALTSEVESTPSAAVTDESPVIVNGVPAPHVHTPQCKHHQKEPTSYDREKDTKALKASRYGDIKDKFNKTFVLENRKTGMVVELRAASSTHACKLINWRPNNAKLIDVREGTQK